MAEFLATNLATSIGLPVAGGGGIPADAPILWLKEDRYNATGTALNEWIDSSGHGNNFVATGSERPFVTLNTLNGLNVVTYFDNNFMSGDSSLFTVPSGDFTMFFVVVPSAIAGTCPVIGCITTGSSKFIVNLDKTGALPAVNFNCGTGSGVSQVLNYEGTKIVICARKTGSELALSLNDSIFSVSSNGEPVTDITTLYLGNNEGAALEYSGLLAEVIIYDRSLLDADCRLITSYLGEKWDIALQDRSITYVDGLLAMYDFKDTITTTTVVNKISQILDKSGRNITLTQSNDGFRPLAAGTVGNCTTAPIFSNAQFLRYLDAIGLSGSEPWTAFVVFDTTTTNTQNGPITFGDATFTSGNLMSIDINIVANQNGIRIRSANIRYGAVYGAGGYFVIAVTYPGGPLSNVKLYVNNELQVSTTSTNPSTVPNLTDNQLIIGAFGNGSTGTTPNFFWSGNLGFFGLWSGVMDPIDLANTYVQLTQRFGV